MRISSAKTTDMTAGSPGKLILSLAVPLMLGSIFQNLYTVVDTMVVGKFVGLDALAAVGSTGNITWGVLAVFMGICQAGLTMMAQRFGGKDQAGFRSALFTLVAAAAAVTAFLTAAGLLLSPWLLRTLNLTGEI